MSLKTSYAEVLTPSTPERDLIWRQGLHRGNQVKEIVHGDPNPMTGVLYKGMDLRIDAHR